MNPLKKLAIRGIDAWRAGGGGSGRIGVECRFRPTCSLYAREAILRHGLMRGVVLGWRRLQRCASGDEWEKIFDPVPARKKCSKRCG